MAVNSTALSDPYDLATLLDQCMGDLEMAEELLDRFESRLESTGDSLQARIDEGDLQAAAAVAHCLKGEAGILAANRLFGSAAQLEQALRTRGSADVPELMNQVLSELQQCLQASPAARSAMLKLQPYQP